MTMTTRTRRARAAWERRNRETTAAAEATETAARIWEVNYGLTTRMTEPTLVSAETAEAAMRKALSYNGIQSRLTNLRTYDNEKGQRETQGRIRYCGNSMAVYATAATIIY